MYYPFHCSYVFVMNQMHSNGMNFLYKFHINSQSGLLSVSNNFVCLFKFKLNFDFGSSVDVVREKFLIWALFWKFHFVYASHGLRFWGWGTVYRSQIISGLHHIACGGLFERGIQWIKISICRINSRIFIIYPIIYILRPILYFSCSPTYDL